ncbi:hypothetical protein CHS0354_020984 [Potamilus streckersoni]|uniref:Protein FAM207A n=1 Tax=Potamilus streckersoni TaxID=2493646 RepID=A0AAE0SYU0_9BIVA|nr:hypothetical protein CHS0354_020984 [Potamilus streckersoni]
MCPEFYLERHIHHSDMGKAKKNRTKVHISAPKPRGDKVRDQAIDKVEIVDRALTEEETMLSSAQPFRLPDNLFKNVKIGKEALQLQKLPDFDAKSTITSKSLKGLQLRKKDKRKLRHELWNQKIDAIQEAKKKEKEKKKKQKTPVVGDIGSLGEALPTLELLLKGSAMSANKESDASKKPKGIEKERKRKQQALQDISLFQQVLKHPVFQENPTATITEHLHNKLKQEEMMDL